jgi:hypothetical protein
MVQVDIQSLDLKASVFIDNTTNSQKMENDELLAEVQQLS